MFTLKNTIGIFIPSTKDLDQPISAEEYNDRILQTAEKLASWFGGFHALTAGFGGFIADDGRLISEDSTLLLAWSTAEAYNQFYNDVVLLASRLAGDWRQESVGVIDNNFHLHLIGVNEKIKSAV